MFQLLEQAPHHSVELIQAYKRKRGPRIWEQEELMELLETSLQSAVKALRIYMFIDALDECGAEEAKKLIRGLQAMLLRLRSADGKFLLGICYACRHFLNFSPEKSKWYEIRVQNENEGDITTYIQQEIEHQWPSVYKSVGQLVQQRAQVVFQWVVLVTEMLIDQAQERADVHYLRKIVEDVPSELGCLYGSLLMNIRGEANKRDALKPFRWVRFAAQPLSLDALRYALVLDPDVASVQLDGVNKQVQNMPTDLRKMVKSLSGGLIEVVQAKYRISSTEKNGGYKTREIAQFIHQSVRDYVDKGDHLHVLGDISENAASFEGRSCRYLARTCLHYLSLLVRGLPTKEVATTAEARRTLLRQDLYEGVVPNIDEHWEFYIDARQSDYLPRPSSFSRPMDQSFFDHAYPLWFHYAGMAEKECVNCAITPNDLQQPLQNLEPYFPILSDLQITKQFVIYKVVTNGLGVLLRAFLKDEAYSELLSLAEVYPRYSGDHFFLATAVRRGHTDVTKLLLELMHKNKRKAIVIGQALTVAVREDRAEMVTLLLDQVECDPGNNSIEEWKRPLIQAIEYGRTQIVSLLLNSGRVDPNLADVDDVAPLACAAGGNSADIMRLLLQKDSPHVDRSKHGGRSLLSFAAVRGLTDVLRLCLQIDKSPRDLADNEGLTPLHWAARHDNAEAARLILEAGNVDVNKQDLNGQTPLSLAAELGRVDVVRVLVSSKRTNLNHTDSHGWTALSLAAATWPYIYRDRLESDFEARNHKATATLKVLLDTADVDPDSIDQMGWSPLCHAVQAGNLEGVMLLVETGKVDVNLNTSPDAGFMGERSLTIAKKRTDSGRRKQIVTFLESHGAYTSPPLQQLPPKQN